MSYSGIILAGGRSSRMGQDKALMEINGIPMLQHLANLLKECSQEIIIASNNEQHHLFGDVGVRDNYKDSGPMAGIEAGLSIARNSQCIVLSCDTPFVTSSILSALTSKNSKHALIARCKDQTHPLIGIYSASTLPTIRSFLEEKQLKMRALLVALNADYEQFPDELERAFININTQEEWNQAIGK